MQNQEKVSGKSKTKKKKPRTRIKLKDIPKYTEIKQMVEATMRRMLIEPCQETQREDIVVFQNGVLRLSEENPVLAFVEDTDAPVNYSHATWAYFDSAVWERGIAADLHLMGEKRRGAHFGAVKELVDDLCPVFSRYMQDWFPGDTAATETVLRWFGYSMTTDTREQKFMFFYGPTRAGKGSLARLLCSLVGSNNYSVANYSAFEDKFQAIGMHDRLVVTMEEVEATPKEHERRLGMLKKYLGGERIVWENKYERAFEDSFVGKLIMQSNEVLAYEDKGRSVTARMVPMEFRESFYGVGEEPPERLILNSGEGNAIATLAAMMWYRMKRNRVFGAFDLKKESWSIINCNAVRAGKGSLLIESHRIAFPFLSFINNKKEKKKGWILCTSERLKDLTELLLEFVGKNEEIRNLTYILKDTVRREFPEAKETCFKISEVGRRRGWKGLYIDTRRLKEMYPEVFENEESKACDLLK